MSTLQCLREQCLAAFGNYVQEAQKTWGLLGDLEDGSVPTLDRLLAVLAQTQFEDQAQGAYLLLRQQLFKVLEEVRWASLGLNRSRWKRTLACNFQFPEIPLASAFGVDGRIYAT